MGNCTRRRRCCDREIIKKVNDYTTSGIQSVSSILGKITDFYNSINKLI